MNPVVVAPKTSTLISKLEGALTPTTGKSAGVLNQPTANPDKFAALLTLLFPGKAATVPGTPPEISAEDLAKGLAQLEGSNLANHQDPDMATVTSDAGQPVPQEGSKKKKGQNPNTALAAVLATNPLADTGKGALARGSTSIQSQGDGIKPSLANLSAPALLVKTEDSAHATPNSPSLPVPKLDGSSPVDSIRKESVGSAPSNSSPAMPKLATPSWDKSVQTPAAGPPPEMAPVIVPGTALTKRDPSAQEPELNVALKPSQGMTDNAPPALAPPTSGGHAAPLTPAPELPAQKNTIVPLPHQESANFLPSGPGSATSSLSGADATVSAGAVGKIATDAESAPARPVASQKGAVSADPGPSGGVTSRSASAEPAPAAPPVSVSSPAEQIQSQISAHLDQLRQMGRVEVRLNLNPPELGRVQLHLTMEDGRMNVRMLVQDDSVKKLMDLQLEPMRVRFSHMGVSVGQFDVRRDGSSPNQNQQSASEPSAQAIQNDKTVTARLRKTYTQLANPNALVDVIA